MKVRTSRPVITFMASAALLVLCFSGQLSELVAGALGGKVYLYVLVVPFVSAYLVFLKRQELTLDDEGRRAWALIPALLGAALLLGYRCAARRGWTPEPDDCLALMVFSFLLLLAASTILFFGVKTVRRLAFPVAFLIFMVPLPVVVRRGIESFFQRGSAGAAEALFRLSGMPVLRDGTRFHLPGFALDVAPQCSGSHSSLVLFILSCLAGYLFLQSPWRRAALALAVVPLGLARNGLRIVTIGHLCVRVSPSMVDSWIHHQGGPLFFALSLIPFGLLLWLLRRSERRRAVSPREATQTVGGRGQEGISRSPDA